MLPTEGSSTTIRLSWHPQGWSMHGNKRLVHCETLKTSHNGVGLSTEQSDVFQTALFMARFFFASMGLSATLSFASLLILCFPCSFAKAIANFSLFVCIENSAFPLLEAEMVGRAVSWGGVGTLCWFYGISNPHPTHSCWERRAFSCSDSYTSSQHCWHGPLK